MNLLVALLALAQDKTAAAATSAFDFGFKQGLAAIGAGLVIIGGGFGIARLAAAAMEGMSRQPEAAGEIRGGMILAAALIEGVTLLALIVCILSIMMK
jgi:F-type H+-transporting ATPase subunit c